MAKKSKTVSDAEKMLKEEIKKRTKRMDEKLEKQNEVPKMDEETIKVLQEIIKDCEKEIDLRYQEAFEELGATEILKENGCEKTSLAENDVDSLLEQGIDFRVRPTLLDSATNRPVKGKAILFVVKKEIEINVLKQVLVIQEKGLSAAMKEFPEDEYLKTAYIAVTENLKQENETN